MAIIRNDLNQTFDSDGNLISEEVVEVDVTAEVVEYDAHTRLHRAIDRLEQAGDRATWQAMTANQRWTVVRVAVITVARLARLVVRRLDSPGVADDSV